MTETFETIAQWCEETFGPARPHRVATRANEELAELLLEADAPEWTDAMRIEAADVLIVLARVPGIWEAVEAKMAINRARRWRLTGDGCGYHIPAPCDEQPKAEDPEGLSGEAMPARSCEAGGAL